MKKRWDYKVKPGETIINTLSQSINVSKPISTILAQRGINTFEAAKSFFRPQLNMLHDPFLMKDMDVAVERIINAIDRNEKILIYGDYDVDGTTSVALFYGALNKFYHNCDFYIPDRYSEGYGISAKSIDWAIEQNIGLVIALDCGIKSIDLIAKAKAHNVDFIICDHHRPGEELPTAIAVLDPKRNDCNYPYKELSGCGIGFKLLQALSVKMPAYNIDALEELDLVAVSIAADIVPVDGENRILTYFGIQQLKKTKKAGLKALMKLAGITNKVDISGIVFGLAPRINAAGRIGHAKLAVELLLAQTEDEAFHFGDKLNLKNQKRKDVDSSITEEALAMIEENSILKSAKTTVLFKNDWHKGVIGIVASRCIEKYHRPTIILTESNNKATGSARSVPGFDVYNAISECEELLEQYGGHMYAAGLTLNLENIQRFQQKFEEVVAGSIPEELLTPLIQIDTEIEFNNITKKFFGVLQQMSPFGPENQQPVFVAENVSVASSLKAIKDCHLKFIAQQENNHPKFEVIGFNLGHLIDELKRGKPFKMAFCIEENNYMGLNSIQLNVKDIKFD